MTKKSLQGTVKGTRRGGRQRKRWEDNIQDLTELEWNLANLSEQLNMCLVTRKPAFSICENKDADQLRSNCAADPRNCFRYVDSTGFKLKYL